MASASTFPSPVQHTIRPTLPPLRSLRLLDIRARSSNLNIPLMPSFHDDESINEMKNLRTPLDFAPRDRQCSFSSLSTTSSREPSPTASWAGHRPSVSRTIRRHHPYLRADKHRVVLSDSFEKADAMLVLPLPAKVFDENNKPILEELKKYKADKAYLVVGPLAVELRNPNNRALLRAAVHPYRFVPRTALGSDLSEPPSSSSSSSECPSSLPTSTANRRELLDTLMHPLSLSPRNPSPLEASNSSARLTPPSSSGSSSTPPRSGPRPSSTPAASSSAH